MSGIVSPDEIEQIVGVTRHATEHWGKAVSAEQTVYVLHSAECRDSGVDLRDCDWSVALDAGIDLDDWIDLEDQPVGLGIRGGRLVPIEVTA